MSYENMTGNGRFLLQRPGWNCAGASAFRLCHLAIGGFMVSTLWIGCAPVRYIATLGQITIVSPGFMIDIPDYFMGLINQLITERGHHLVWICRYR